MSLSFLIVLPNDNRSGAMLFARHSSTSPRLATSKLAPLRLSIVMISAAGLAFTA
jgi:hypothetical protein